MRKAKEQDHEARTRRYYDAFSERYERGRHRGYHRMVDDLEIGVVRPYADGQKVLEVGCGTGLILERLSEFAREATGLDLSPGMLEVARARGLDVAEGSATAIPFPDDSFDCVCSFKVLPHVEDLGRAMAEICRVTRPGGHMVLEFYNPLSLRYLAKLLGGARATGEAQTEADVYTRWDSTAVVRRVLPPGAEVVDFRGVRVVTPTALLHRVPGVSTVLCTVERACVGSPLRYFGGFLIAVLRKQ